MQGLPELKSAWDMASQGPTCTQELGSSSTSVCAPSLLGDSCSILSPAIRGETKDPLSNIFSLTELAVADKNAGDTRE